MVRYFLYLEKNAYLLVNTLVTAEWGIYMTLVIGIITTIITILIIALEIMIGYERGIRRNLVRTIMLILVAVLTMYITPPTVELIVRELILTNRLNDYLYGLTGVNPSDYLFVQKSTVNLFTVFLNPFIYVALFWVLKLISFGLYLLIDRYIIKKKLMKLFPSPTRKSSIAGGVLGGVYAVLIGAIFFMPISAYSELLRETEKASIVMQGEDGAVSDLLGTDNYRIAVSYQRTPSYYFYKYTGSKYLGDAMFTTLSTKSTETATVSVNRYIPSIARVYQAAKFLQGMNQGTEATDIDGYIFSMNVIVEEFASQELITGTDQEKLSLLKDYLQQSTAINENSMLQLFITNMDYESITALQQDMRLLTELSTILEEKEMLSDILNYTSELSPQELIDKLDKEFIVQIADKLYSMDQAEIIVPLITEKLLGLLLEDGGVGADALNQIENFGDTKQEFIEVCQSGKQLAYLMNYEVGETEAIKFLEESITVIRNSKLIHKDTLQELERILANKLKIYNELP